MRCCSVAKEGRALAERCQKQRTTAIIAHDVEETQGDLGTSETTFTYQSAGEENDADLDKYLHRLNTFSTNTTI
jgi:hypothetical protein